MLNDWNMRNGFMNLTIIIIITSKGTDLSYVKFCYIFAMVNCTYISRESSNVIQFHLKTSFQSVKDNKFKCKV